MIFSKSFGYALQGVLYVALLSDGRDRIQLDEIARILMVPRYFLGKIMNRLGKEGILISVKGHNGGFGISETTFKTPLLTLAELTGDMVQLDSCVLKSRTCNNLNPCPLHHKIEPLREEWKKLLAGTTIGDLVKGRNPDFIRSISAI